MKSKFIIQLVVPIMLLSVAQSTEPTETPENPTPQQCNVNIELPESIEVNVDDDNANEEWDKDETGLEEEDDLKAGAISIAVPEDYSGTVIATFIKGGELVGGVAWTDQTKTEQHPLVWTIENGVLKEDPAANFFIEGRKHSAEWADVEMRAVISETEGPCDNNFDTAVTTVVELDLDIDSDINNGLEDPSRGDAEDKRESLAASPEGEIYTGKVILVNDGIGDGIPDWADGFESNESTTLDDSLSNIKFVPVKLERKPPFTKKALVTFTYASNDPIDVTATTGGFVDDPINHPFTYQKGSGKIRIWKKDNIGKRNEVAVPDGDFVPGQVQIPWEDLSAGAVADLWVEAVGASDSVCDESIYVEIEEGVGKARDKVLVTLLKLEAEPITSSSPHSEVWNPAGVVVGDTGLFQMSMFPWDFPQDKLVWKTNFISGTFSDQSGGTVRFQPSTAANLGEIYLDIDGNYGPPPRFELVSYPSYTTVKVRVYEVRGTGPSLISENQVTALMGRLNQIFKQSGMIMTIDEFTPLTGGEYDGYRVIEPGNEGALLVDSFSQTDCIEMYVVDSIEGGVAGKNIFEAGLIVSNDFGPVTFAALVAHEIGHEAGLEDIYTAKSYNDSNPATSDHEEVGDSLAQVSWNLWDWPNINTLGIEPACYTRDNELHVDPIEGYARRQIGMIRSLVMFGEIVDGGSNRDIPRGEIYGVLGGYSWSQLRKGQGKVGLSHIDRNPKH